VVAVINHLTEVRREPSWQLTNVASATQVWWSRLHRDFSASRSYDNATFN
jgi:hypothetical protein